MPIPRPDPRRRVFETVRLHEASALRIESHLARLRASVAALYTARLPDSLEDEIAVAVRRAQGRRRLRINVVPAADGSLQVSLDLGPSRPSGTVALRTRTLPGGLGPHKWADRRLITAMEADTSNQLPLLVDADSGVLETSRANLFALGADGVLRTPPNDGRILPGVTRAHVLSHACQNGLRVSAEPLVTEELISARGVVLTNALGITTVLAIDDHPLCIDGGLGAGLQSVLQAGRPTA